VASVGAALAGGLGGSSLISCPCIDGAGEGQNRFLFRLAALDTFVRFGRLGSLLGAAVAPVGVRVASRKP
jgi:hypothetical protein